MRRAIHHRRLGVAHAVLVSALLTTLVVTSTGCGFFPFVFSFDREVELKSGEIKGQALRKDLDGNPPAPYAKVTAQGVGAVRRAGADGRFKFSGLSAGAWVFRVDDDVDGDGWPERSTSVSALVRNVAKLDTSGATQDEAPTAVFLGRVLVDGTTEVKGRVVVDTPTGRVTPQDAGVIARVLITRDFDLPTEAADAFNTVNLGAEAQTAADKDGNFVFTSVATGTFQVVAFLFDDTGNPLQPGALRSVSTPAVLRGFAGESLDIIGAPLLAPGLSIGPVDDTRPVQITLSPVTESDVYVVVVPQGQEAPACESPAPTTYEGTPFAYARVTDVVPGNGDVLIDLPLGIFDVVICTVDGTDGPFGVMYAVNINPPLSGSVGTVPLPLGPVLMTTSDACLTVNDDGDAIRDCDGDGVAGLPIFDASNQALWTSCVASCEGAFGEFGDVRQCVVGGAVYDCDDDGDGQPDVTESPACYGIGRGTDLDGDGLCSGSDPFPQCAANNADDCIAGEFDFTPQVPTEFGGTSPVTSAFDAAFGGQAGIRITTPGSLDALGRAVAIDAQSRTVVVGTVEDELASTTSMAVWRVNTDGTVDESFGGGTGVFQLDQHWTPTVPTDNTEGFSIVFGVDEKIYIAANVVGIGNASSRTVIVELSSDGTIGDTAFGAENDTGADGVYELSLSPSFPRNGVVNIFRGTDALYTVGNAQQNDGASGGVFVCAHDVTSGELIAAYSLSAPVPGCVTDGDGASATSAAFVNNTVVIGGTEAGSSLIWPIQISGEGPFTFSPQEPEQTPGARGRVVAIAGDSSRVLGGLIVVEVDDNGSHSIARSSNVSAFFFEDTGAVFDQPDLHINGVVVDDDANVVLIGHTQGADDVSELFLGRFNMDDGTSSVIADFVSADDARETALFAGTLNANNQVVVVGGIKPTGGEEVKIDVGVWRLNPLGAGATEPELDAGVSIVDEDAGNTGDRDGGTQLQCASISPFDSTCGDFIDCTSPLLPACVASACVCADPCDPNVGDDVHTGDISGSNGEDLFGAGLTNTTTCVEGDVTIEALENQTLAGFGQLRRITGSLIIRDNDVVVDGEITFEHLASIGGSLAVSNNADADGYLRLLQVPELKTASFISFVENDYLSTAAISEIVDGLTTPTTTTVYGNGCVVDAECMVYDGASLCVSDTLLPVTTCTGGPE